MNEVASAILMNDRSLEADPMCATVKEIFSSVGHDRITQKDRERAELLSRVRGRGNGAGTPSNLNR
jgi:hypothetical protein